MSNLHTALATVVTDDFLPGACVAIDSFARHNGWFDGDIVVIHRDLSEPAQSTLKAVHERVIFHAVGADLAERMCAVSKAAAWAGDKAMQFASIEALSLTDYDCVVFCDSDLLFLGSIEECLEIDASVVACGDGAYFRGNARRFDDFAEVGPDSQLPATQLAQNTFNTGMMILRQDALSEANYRNLVTMVEPDRWADDTTGHTDQMLFNIHFSGKQALAPIRYNYLITHRDLIQSTSGCRLEDAAVVHFTGSTKPWLPAEHLTALGIDSRYFEAYAKWRHAASQIEATVFP